MNGKSPNKVTVEQLLSLIPDEDLSALAVKTKVDYQTKVLFGRNVFYLLLYGLIECERASLRSLEDVFNSRRFKLLFNLDAGQTTRHNSLSDRLANMNVQFFEDAYKMMYGLFSTHYTPKEALKYNITRVDSTMVAEAANKLDEGMGTGMKKNGKKQVKYTMCLNGLFPSSVQIFTKQSQLSEDKTIPETILKIADNQKDNVFVFDPGVQNRGAFVNLDQKQFQFVTRVKANSRYQVIEALPMPKSLNIGNLTIISDQWVYLYQSKNKKINTPFRLLITKDESDNRFLFLTNMRDTAENTATAEDIITIYKNRWGIEVFFRFIKQELNFSHFLSTNLNGIKIILYMTLILAMLIQIYKKYNDVGYKTAKRRIRMELEELLTIAIVKMCGGDPNIAFRGP